MKRIQRQAIINGLEKKMAFIVGRRQAGKTWLAKDIAHSVGRPVYRNYDNPIHRKKMMEQDWLETTDLLILDELHKMAEWKNYLKGLYDT